ncbi:CDP-glucose 4,6-dehydratase [Aquirufa nivalisilvae]|uniref:CDP-glucose 4,6-dehydratase n=1 Tax=Aquirufa nivalisilvae TaxID=2516557 RepID=UPI0022A93200|nr:CDP-glucose 4,6-dehydratase [Aquirufa nivalisilvae]MCZ2479765.1 CDP-glucose 4,6-dehydratase [Aquirufa nivalisilvae]
MEKMVMNQFYQGKRVLLTGDTGFKGSWLALWLHSMGANVLGYALAPTSKDDHFNLLNLANDIEHIDGNLLDSQLLNDVFERFQPEIVFHLAAQALVRLSYDDPKTTFDTNVSGSVNLLEAVRKTKSVKSLIYVTSDKCYKNNEWIWGYRENDALGGHDPYSASKAAAELVFSSYIDSFFSKNESIGVASVRAGNVIGGGDWALDRIIPDCIRSISRNIPIEIRSPNSTRPWQHVLEPLSGYLLLGQRLYESPKEFSGAWNFGPEFGSVKTVLQLVESCIQVYGSGEVMVGKTDGTKHEAGLLHLNCEKAKHGLAWHPVWGFEQTVFQTISWYKDFKNGVNPREISMNHIHNYLANKR